MRNKVVVKHHAYRIEKLLNSEATVSDHKNRLIKKVSEIMIELYKDVSHRKSKSELQNSQNKINYWFNTIKNILQIDIIPEEDNFNIILETEVYLYALEIINHSQESSSLSINHIHHILTLFLSKTIQYHTHTLSTKNKVFTL